MAPLAGTAHSTPDWRKGQATNEQVTPPLPDVRHIVGPYEGANDRRAAWALATSLPPFVAMWWLMHRSLVLPYWVTLALAIPTAGFAVRIFIVQHDCGHGSFFRSARLRLLVGRICSLVTLMPYAYFRRTHGAHHATSGKLEHRGVDIETLTVREYLALSRAGRLRYRLFRNPLVLFGIAPILYFAVATRFPWLARRTWKRERNSILLTNAALAIAVWAILQIVEPMAFLKVQLPITVMASFVGMWMFYVQHQFEGTYWAGEDAWDYTRAALQGSSYYALPAVLEWFTGYIGLHHVHHLSPRVPSYRLADCHRSSPLLSTVPRIGLRDSVRCARLKLWDEESQRLVGWQR